jgi:hypothetical protein
MAHLNAVPQIGLEDAPVIYTRLVAHGGSIRHGADLHTIEATRLEPRITAPNPPIAVIVTVARVLPSLPAVTRQA